MYSIWKCLPDGRLSWVAREVFGDSPRDAFRRFVEGFAVGSYGQIGIPVVKNTTYLVFNPKINTDTQGQTVFRYQAPPTPRAEVVGVNLATATA